MKLNLTHGFSICSIISLEIRWRYNHMSNKVLKPKKASLYEFTRNYSNNIGNCIEFFKSMKWPEGNSSDRCGCHKYYLVKRVGKTKTALLLESKCRILMSLSNSEKLLNSHFMRQMSLILAQNPRIKQVVQVSSSLF